MMAEGGVNVDHTTIYRWAQRSATEMEKRLRWQWFRPRSRSFKSMRTAYARMKGFETMRALRKAQALTASFR